MNKNTTDRPTTRAPINGAEQLEQFRQWIGDRDVFMQTLPSAAWRIVPAGEADKFMNAIAELEAKQGHGIFFGINPMKAGTKGVPSEPDISRRRLLFLDVDHPDHDPQIPANDVGKQMSRETFERVVTYLDVKGWSAPVRIDIRKRSRTAAPRRWRGLS